MLSKKIFAGCMALAVSLASGIADDFFKTQNWQEIKEAPKPTPKGALFIPEIKQVPSVLKDKISVLKAKGLKLDFVTYPSGQTPKMESSTYAGFDKKNLYLILDGEQSKGYAPKENKHETETAHIWHDDNFEVFIDPFLSRNEYMHFIINPLAEAYDAQCFIKMVSDPKAADQSVLMPKLEADMSYSSGAKIETQKNKAGWTVCLSVPFSSLGIDAPPLGQPWGFNFCHTNREIKELSQWKVTSGGLGFHTPGKYGVLIFGDKKPAVGSDFAWTVAGYGKNILELKSDNSGAARKGTAEITLVEKENKVTQLLKKEIEIPNGNGKFALPFNVPLTAKDKFKITGKLTVDGDTSGYFLKTLTLEAPAVLSVPLTQIYTSDKAIKGSVRLYLGGSELKEASLKFEIIKGGKAIKSSVIKKMSGNYLKFGIKTKGIKPGKCLLKCNLTINGKTIFVLDKKIEIVESPFSF